MKGLNSKDESERREAMARSEKFLAEREKQKKAKSGSSEAEGCHVTADRTVVNKMDEVSRDSALVLVISVPYLASSAYCPRTV